AGGDAGEHEATTLAAGTAVGLEQDAEPGRVPDLDVAEVEEQVADAVVDRGVESEAQIGRRADVDASLDHDLLAAGGVDDANRYGRCRLQCHLVPLVGPRPVWAPGPCGPNSLMCDT